VGWGKPPDLIGRDPRCQGRQLPSKRLGYVPIHFVGALLPESKGGEMGNCSRTRAAGTHQLSGEQIHKHRRVTVSNRNAYLEDEEELLDSIPSLGGYLELAKLLSKFGRYGEHRYGILESHHVAEHVEGARPASYYI
jgi:hypothetical protein